MKKALRLAFENSLFLIAGTLIALLWANLHYSTYEPVSHALHFLVNDILMALFFALAAKEVWEAMLPEGVLSSPKKAAMPLMATAGGIFVPAVLYILGALMFDPVLVRGWAIPCATDIAFSYLVARTLFGTHHPAIPFLLLLAIADDGIGLFILAVFYPQGEVRLALFSILVGPDLAKVL
jgi:NhaA family Na+:H+ antiporter